MQFVIPAACRWSQNAGLTNGHIKLPVIHVRAEDIQTGPKSYTLVLYQLPMLAPKSLRPYLIYCASLIPDRYLHELCLKHIRLFCSFLTLTLWDTSSNASQRFYPTHKAAFEIVRYLSNHG